MSSIEYRKRLREKEEQTQQGRLSAFRSLRPGSQAEPIETPALPETNTEPETEKEPQQVAAPQASTPQELRDAAQTLVQQLLSLPEEEYQQQMLALQEENPVLYAVVVDELNNLQPEAQEADAPEVAEEEQDVDDVDGSVADDEDSAEEDQE